MWQFYLVDTFSCTFSLDWKSAILFSVQLKILSAVDVMLFSLNSLRFFVIKLITQILKSVKFKTDDMYAWFYKLKKCRVHICQLLPEGRGPVYIMDGNHTVHCFTGSPGIVQITRMCCVTVAWYYHRYCINLRWKYSGTDTHTHTHTHTHPVQLFI